MKTLLLCCLGLVLLTAEACDKAEVCKQEEVYFTAAPCSSDNRAVRTLTNVEGKVRFDQTLQQYTIWAHQPGTVDVVSIGVVCGTLSKAIQAEELKISFSGTYKEYSQPPVAPAGYTYYYLELSKLEILK